MARFALISRCSLRAAARPPTPRPAAGLIAARAGATRTFATAEDQPGRRLDNRVKIVEVGPRDGLQNEKKSIPLATKIELIERLAKTGLSWIEAGSFVSPKWVPQVSQPSQSRYSQATGCSPPPPPPSPPPGDI